MKLIFTAACILCVAAAHAAEQTPITVTIGSQAASGRPIPSDFVGLSFGMKALLPQGHGALIFSPTNKTLITIFQNIGLHHLRMGGTTVEVPTTTPIPGKIEIDNLFAFAKEAGVEKIIYSFRLLETSPELNIAATNAALAKYIWDRYRPQLDAFALGNEPDLDRVYHQDYAITNFDTYLAKWRRFAAAITNAVPEAKFAGPDGGSGNVKWTVAFAEKQKNSGLVSVITEHFYVGAAGRNVTPQAGIDAILSPLWNTRNEKLFEKMALPVREAGFPLRFTEASDHYTGGVPDASNTFAAALWALDYLHWWAAHGAVGVNFHNTQWVVNAVVRPDSDGAFVANPKGYGIRAFNLGSNGSVEPLSISNSAGINLTAYAIRGAKEHFVTLINKEHGAAAHEARVTIDQAGTPGRGEIIYLTPPNGDVSAKEGITLGDDSISNDKPWNGKWKPLGDEHGKQVVVKLPAASAAIVKLPL